MGIKYYQHFCFIKTLHIEFDKILHILVLHNSYKLYVAPNSIL